MLLVEVVAIRDYEGVQWSGLFETPSDAIGYLRKDDPEEYRWLDDISIRWVKVGDPTFYKPIHLCAIDYDEAKDTVFCSQWDPKEKGYVRLFAIGDCREVVSDV